MFCFDYLAGYCMNIIFIFLAISLKLQLENRSSVIMIKLFIIKHRIRSRNTSLGQRNFLSFFQCDVWRRLPIFNISRIIIIIVNSNDSRTKSKVFNRILGTITHFSQEIVTWKNRTRFQLENNTLFVSINILYKIASFIDFYNQILKYYFTFFANVIRI